MPLPVPKPGEEKNNFIARCMINDKMRGEFPDLEQRLAVCEKQWENKE